jgi:tight adherence protein C
MTPDLLLPIALLFVSIALITGFAASALLARNSPERARLREMSLAATGAPAVSAARPTRLVEQLDPNLERLARALPKSPKEMGRLRRRLAAGGIDSYRAAVAYAVAEIVLPILFAAAVWGFVSGPSKWVFVVAAVLVGYMIPGFYVGRLVAKQKIAIEDGLPDALDLMIVCVEAGCGLDQAIVKTSEELAISHPALAAELRLVTTEVKAGKPRLDAFKNFAARTQVDDVRALVAMLVQTDRFGTSESQALRTHAATSRTKRRQRAEERAAKIGVKMVFPLVFCLFPAFYVVALGPGVIKFIRFFNEQLN